MSSQAETPSTDKSDTTTTESAAPRHAKDFDLAGGTGLIADPAADDSVRILPIVPPAGPNPAPNQTSTGTTERSTATPDTPVITGLDTMAGPETAAPAHAPDRTPASEGTGGGGAVDGGTGSGFDGDSGGVAGDGTGPGGANTTGGGIAVATGTAPAPADGIAVVTGTAPAPADGIAVVTGTAPGPADGIDLERPASPGDVSAERLPTRLSINKAKHAAAAQTGIFRLGDLVHSDARPTPEGSHMLGIVAWGTALALAGVGVGIRGLAAIIGGLAPAWYQPALIGAGLLGVLLTVAAFVTIQRRYAPWLMLAFATIPLAVSIALTIIAL
ncbi:hypothetical protein DFJ67_0789 [Asanoa ferruginea]|uniref:Uncharacterized protein n=1 Tax=Asanoa ferruginea TaxID=53367 RepID=A0A3D9ZEA2_9ACTN|nr:hypothetical protein [Asanoa ferruginea]REF94844.1 hypothetical protein DFJ67_0789 [Asanoa ferruginea]GIF45577.1 hypothetical protein Afe04nite_01160 [Asanoa ferruginea]